MLEKGVIKGGADGGAAAHLMKGRRLLLAGSSGSTFPAFGSSSDTSSSIFVALMRISAKLVESSRQDPRVSGNGRSFPLRVEI